MNKIITSAGMLAAGVSSLYAENVTGLTEVQQSKPWNVSAAVRAFYDSNPLTLHSDPVVNGRKQSKDSFGFEIIPSVGVFHTWGNSIVSAKYTYTYRWYDDRPGNNDTDQQHEAEAKFHHKFNDHTELSVEDYFAYSNEPSVVDSTGFQTSPLRTKASVYRNRLPIEYKTRFSEQFGTSAGYQWTYYNYTDNGPGTRSALLDRMEHLAHIDLDYYLEEHFNVLLGYQFGYVDYQSSDSIFLVPQVPDVRGKDRNALSHYFYVGAERAFSDRLSGAIKAGVVYTDYTELNQNDWSPYADGSLAYVYLPGSTLKVGLRIAHNSTDVAGSNTDPTLDQESYVAYVQVSHRITAKLGANVLAQYQHSIFNGGLADGDADDYFILAANLHYQINPHLFAEAGYNLDSLTSDQSARGFTRNRVYVGVGANY
jgi:hypothetical protein